RSSSARRGLHSPRACRADVDWSPRRLSLVAGRAVEKRPGPCPTKFSRAHAIIPSERSIPMGNVFHHDFQAIPESEGTLGELLRERLLQTLAEAGFRKTSAERAVSVIVGYVNEDLAQIGTLSFTTSISVDPSLGVL